MGERGETVKIRCEYTELVDPKILIDDPQNTNTHTQDDIESMAKVLEYQGWREPIRADKNLRIRAGHKRKKAAIYLGLEKIPVSLQEYDSDTQATADMISDNASGKRSKTDFEMINLILPDLGPELNIDCLGLVDFHVDPADKKKDKKQRECPHCGEVI
jgi:hypothetical protein